MHTLVQMSIHNLFENGEVASRKSRHVWMDGRSSQLERLRLACTSLIIATRICTLSARTVRSFVCLFTIHSASGVAVWRCARISMHSAIVLVHTTYRDTDIFSAEKQRTCSHIAHAYSMTFDAGCVSGIIFVIKMVKDSICIAFTLRDADKDSLCGCESVSE